MSTMPKMPAEVASGLIDLCAELTKHADAMADAIHEYFLHSDDELRKAEQALALARRDYNNFMKEC